MQLLSVTSFSYTYFITYFISYFNENVLLTIIINRLSSTLKIVLINCQNFDLTNIYSIANLVQGTKIWNNSELSTPAYAAAAAYFGKTPPSFLKYGGVQHWFQCSMPKLFAISNRYAYRWCLMVSGKIRTAATRV